MKKQSHSGRKIAENSIVALRRDEILRIARSHGAMNVRLFGSYARGGETSESDLDILVTLEPHRSLLDLIAIKQDLEDELEIEVDVVTEASLSPYFREQVIKETILL
jgi:predicted nucleotidyltransferase